jgi:hypothetical protein
MHGAETVVVRVGDATDLGVEVEVAGMSCAFGMIRVAVTKFGVGGDCTSVVIDIQAVRQSNARVTKRNFFP